MKPTNRKYRIVKQSNSVDFQFNIEPTIVTFTEDMLPRLEPPREWGDKSVIYIGHIPLCTYQTHIDAEITFLDLLEQLNDPSIFEVKLLIDGYNQRVYVTQADINEFRMHERDNELGFKDGDIVWGATQNPLTLQYWVDRLNDYEWCVYHNLCMLDYDRHLNRTYEKVLVDVGHTSIVKQVHDKVIETYAEQQLLDDNVKRWEPDYHAKQLIEARGLAI